MEFFLAPLSSAHHLSRPPKEREKWLHKYTRPVHSNTTYVSPTTWGLSSTLFYIEFRLEARRLYYSAVCSEHSDFAPARQVAEIRFLSFQC
jgi:hypothetical protein